MSTVHEVFGSGGNYARLKTQAIFGVECEVESVLNGGHHLGGFKCVQDGSLRNNGWEYTTGTPTTRAAIISEFNQLHVELKLNPKFDAFSERTSTHVHMNISSMEEQHAKQTLMLYALFEEFFFSMVKPCRRDNIHCVPLTETHLPSKYHQSFASLVNAWSKYSALNLVRVADLGTMEFRHLQGTNDPVLLDTWLHVLENLWKVSQRITISPETLADKKQIEEWFELIFFPANNVMMLKPSLFDIIQNSLIDVKLAFSQ